MKKYKLSYKKIRRIVEKLKQNYDLIIFDTSTETLLDYTKEIMKEVEKNNIYFRCKYVRSKKIRKTSKNL